MAAAKAEFAELFAAAEVFKRKSLKILNQTIVIEIVCKCSRSWTWSDFFCFEMVCMFEKTDFVICLITFFQAGEHAALAPVNNDVQASQVPAEYLEDTEDVAAAKVTLRSTLHSTMT